MHCGVFEHSMEEVKGFNLADSRDPWIQLHFCRGAYGVAGPLWSPGTAACTPCSCWAGKHVGLEILCGCANGCVSLCLPWALLCLPLCCGLMAPTMLGLLGPSDRWGDCSGRSICTPGCVRQKRGEMPHQADQKSRGGNPPLTLMS